MSEVVSTIESKVGQLQEEIQKRNKYLSELNEAIKKLRFDRKSTISVMEQMNGAIQAYAASAQLIKDTSPKTDMGSIPLVGEVMGNGNGSS